MDKTVTTIPAPRGGIEPDWWHWSMVYQKQLRKLMKLICAEGYSIRCDEHGIPYKIERKDV